MSNTVLGAGIACLIAAIVGGGLQGFGMKVPVVSSLRRQTLLGAFGVILMFSSLAPEGAISRLLNHRTWQPSTESSTNNSFALPKQALPDIPEADSGFIDGGSSPHAFCDPQLKALQAKYPGVIIDMTVLPEEHKSVYNPFKHDLYRYRCSFAVQAR